MVAEMLVSRTIGQGPEIRNDPDRELSHPLRWLGTRLGAGLTRIGDFLIAAVFLGCALPLMPIIAVAIKLDTAGPVFRRSVRVGYDDRSYVAIDFRTTAIAPGRPGWVVRDSYTTRVGRVLRATDLDRLPQLINVLRGELTILGTSPARGPLGRR